MKKKLRLHIGQYSSAGRKLVNQDFHGAYIPEEPSLSSKGIAIAIADGISSSDVSQVASETAIKSFLYDYYCTSDAWSVKSSGQRVLKAVNLWLYAQTQKSDRRFNKDRGYVCTFSAMIIKSNTAHLFSIGDSRIYKVAGNVLEQLTTDHRRTISADVSYLTRGLGIQNCLAIDYRSLSIDEGDIFILATDGVYEYLPEAIIVAAIKTAKENQEDLTLACKQLVDAAYDEGSSDNLTLQVVEVVTLPEKNLEEVQGSVHLLPLPPRLQERKMFDGYEIIREIYMSSRSHVHLAKDTGSGKLVVLKTPSIEMRSNEEHLESYLESFLMEDWIAKRLNNPHILKAVSGSRKQNYLYTVTEYIEGKTLAQWIRDNPSPTIDSVRGILEQVAKGLQAFNRQEMVHQDLRPNNIMIDALGTVKIIDFGATKVAGISEISPKNEGVVGTAQYTAPEYFVGNSGTHQSDIFSLGVLAYQMLSGELPYGNAVAKAQSVRSQQRLNYLPLNRVGHTQKKKTSIPGWVDYAIKKAVDVNPEKRYIEVSEFIHELKYPNTHYQNQAKPPLIERNPVLVWQCIALVLVGVIVYQHLS